MEAGDIAVSVAAEIATVAPEEQQEILGAADESAVLDADKEIKRKCATDRDAAMDWIDANQLGRRNLPPHVMSVLRGRIYNRRKKKQVDLSVWRRGR